MYKPVQQGIVGNNANGGLSQNVVQPYQYQDNISKKPYVKQHTIILNSQDRTGGTLTNAVFTINKAQDIIGDRGYLVASSFFINNDTANTVGENRINQFTYEVRLNGFSQPLSYNSSTGGTSQTIIVNKGFVYQNQNGLGGFPIVNYNMFKGQQLGVEIVSRDVNIGNTWTQNWTLVLLVIEEGDSNP